MSERSEVNVVNVWKALGKTAGVFCVMAFCAVPVVGVSLLLEYAAPIGFLVVMLLMLGGLAYMLTAAFYADARHEEQQKQLDTLYEQYAADALRMTFGATPTTTEEVDIENPAGDEPVIR